MKKILLSSVVVALFGIMGSALAANNGDDCNGNGSCATGATTNNITNHGGAGGAGGAGGSASAYGGAGGSAVAGATGGSVKSDIKNTVNSSNTNVNANSNSNKNTVNSSNVQGQIQGQAQKQSTENSNNSSNSVTVQGDNFEARRIPVSTAFAPSIAPTANCALSVSGGVSFIGFSGSFGKAYIDENCAALERVRTVSLVLGDKSTAEALMCLDEKYKKARLNAGRACPVEQE